MVNSGARRLLPVALRLTPFSTIANVDAPIADRADNLTSDWHYSPCPDPDRITPDV